jgi:hypothetical protein
MFERPHSTANLAWGGVRMYFLVTSAASCSYEAR